MPHPQRGTQAARLPLIWFGLAWMLTYACLQLAPLGAALTVAVLRTVAASVLARLAVGPRSWQHWRGASGGPRG